MQRLRSEIRELPTTWARKKSFAEARRWVSSLLGVGPIRSWPNQRRGVKWCPFRLQHLHRFLINALVLLGWNLWRFLWKKKTVPSRIDLKSLQRPMLMMIVESFWKSVGDSGLILLPHCFCFLITERQTLALWSQGSETVKPQQPRGFRGYAGGPAWATRQSFRTGVLSLPWFVWLRGRIDLIFQFCSGSISQRIFCSCWNHFCAAG